MYFVTSKYKYSCKHLKHITDYVNSLLEYSIQE